MTIYDFEGGSDGNAASTANTGASVVAAGAGNTLTLSSAGGVVSGGLALRAHVGAITNSCWAEFAALAAQTAQSLYVEIELSADGYVGALTSLVQGYLTGDATVAFRLNVSSAGALTISDVGVAHSATIAADITARYGQKIAVRLQMNSGSTTANGVLKARYYSDPYAAVGTYIGTETSVTTWNLGAGVAFGKLRVGINTPQTTVPGGGRDTFFDYLNHAAGESWLAPPTVASTPTSNAGPDQYIQAGTSVTMAASGTIGTGGGTITGGIWTNTERPPGAATAVYTNSSPTTTVTNLVAGIWKFLWKATQSGGGLSDPVGNEVILWVHPASGVAVKPYLVTETVGITREGSAATDEAALSDSDPTTLMRTEDAPVAAMFTITWCPAGPLSLSLEFDGAIGGTGTVHRTINHYLEDGTTLLDGPYEADLTSSTVTPMPAGLDSGANVALGTNLATRRKLVTKITDNAV